MRGWWWRGRDRFETPLTIQLWYEIIGDNTIAEAILDLILNNAHRIELQGEYLRKKGAKNRIYKTLNLVHIQDLSYHL